MRIQRFSDELSVLDTAQRPRKLSILGSDGAQYTFLLKGREDLRQDERVMQLFGLMNRMLSNLKGAELEIRCYAVPGFQESTLLAQKRPPPLSVHLYWHRLNARP